MWGRAERQLTWKCVCAPCLRAGLLGATGLSVLQKWMLESRGLGVSSRGVYGETNKLLPSSFMCRWSLFQTIRNRPVQASIMLQEPPWYYDYFILLCLLCRHCRAETMYILNEWMNAVSSKLVQHLKIWIYNRVWGCMANIFPKSF